MSTTASLFHGLDDIPWSTLEHAYGTAEDTPQRLRALAEGDDAARADARYWLGASIHHQGTIYPATPPAVPFLVRLAADRGVKDRPWIVHFLADLAVSTPARWLWAGFDLTRPDMKAYFDGDDAEPFRATYDAVESALPALLGLLDDEDPGVRANAAFTSSFFARHAARVREALRARATDETDPVALATILVALAIQDNYLGDASSQPLFAAHLTDDLPVSLAAAVALGYGSAPSTGADARAVPVLAAVLGRTTAIPVSEAIPWSDGDLARMALSQMNKHVPTEERDAPGPRVAELQAIYFPLIERVTERSPRRDVDLALAAAVPLFATVTPASSPAEGWTRETLRPTLRRFAEAMAMRPFLTSPALFGVLAENGLPDDLEPLQDWLGVRPPSALDTVIEAAGGKRTVREWRAHLTDAATTEAVVRAAAEDADAVAIAFALSCAGATSGTQVGAIGTMTYSFAGGPDAAKKEDPLPDRLVDAAVERAPERAYEVALGLAREHATSGPPGRFTRQGTQIQTPAFTLLCRVAHRVHARTGQVPDAAFDVMSEAQLGAPAVWPALAPYYAAVPGERRDAFFLGLAERGWKHSWPATFGVNVGDTLPAILDAMTPEGREELLARTARGSDFRAVLPLLRRSPSARVLDLVCDRIRGTLDEMKNWAKDRIDQQAKQDADALGALGPWAAGVVLRHALQGGEPPLFARALDVLRSRSYALSAMYDARSPLDDRGLMPLATARSLLGETRTFRRGESEEVDGTMVDESDRVWAALLSLEDTAEFVKEATRLSWEFHVRGRDNLAPLERYGEGIVPWLRSRLRADGVLVNVPWCVVPCLLAIPSGQALELALATRAVHELLPGQPALGGGPGAFAAPEGGPVPSGVRADADAVHGDGPARAFLSRTEGLDLAKRWLAQNPSGYGLLASLAEDGNERAVALLRERARALGGAVVEALAAALGEERAGGIVQRFELPRPALDARVRAILDEAPVADVPRGPVWSIAELDDAAREYELQLWDNMNYTTGAMRVTGFASAEGDVLAVETIESSTLQSEPLRWRLCAYGPGARKRGASEALIDEGDLDDVWLTGDEDRVDAVTNHLVLGGDRDEQGKLVEGSEARVAPAPFPFAYQTLTVKRACSEDKPEELHVTYRVPASFASLPEDVRAKLRWAVDPLQAMVFRLCAEHVDAMWPEDDDLRGATGAPDGARVLFRFDALAWPQAGEPASSSLDLVTMTEALRTRREITRLPSTPNTRPEHWLRVPEDASPEDAYDTWGGEEPIAPAPPEPARGVDAYWSDLLARGWPHGVMLMHGPEWNGKGQAEQTVPYLLDSAAPAMHVFWPRRAACMFLRAVGGLKKHFGSKDAGAGAVREGANDALVGLGEARRIVRALASHAFPVPAHVGAELAGLLEALVGGPQTVAIFAELLAERPDDVWSADHEALAAAVFELGFVLRRCGKARDTVRSDLARAHRAGAMGDVARALDLVLHGRAGAERSARTELDHAHATDDPAWACARIVDPSTPASPIDAALFVLGGDALLDKWAPRLAAAPDPRWLATQLCVLGGDRALSLVLRLYAERKDARDAVKNKLGEREDRVAALERLVDGPDGVVARELIEALDE